MVIYDTSEDIWKIFKIYSYFGNFKNFGKFWRKIENFGKKLKILEKKLKILGKNFQSRRQILTARGVYTLLAFPFK